MERPVLPEGCEYVRTTAVWDATTVPAGLLRAHHVAQGVWGRLVVHAGTVRFVFEDAPDDPIVLSDDEALPIPPLRKHHVELDGEARISVEFYRAPQETTPTEGTESTGLTGGD